MRPSARRNTGFTRAIDPRAAFPAGTPWLRGGYRVAAALLMAALLTASAGAPAAVPGASVTITVHGSDGRPVPGAVITVRSLAADARPSAPIKAVMDQVNRAFDPDLL